MEAAKVAGTTESNDIPLKCYLNAKTHTQQEQMRAQEDNGLKPACMSVLVCVGVSSTFMSQGLSFIKTFFFL